MNIEAKRYNNHLIIRLTGCQLLTSIKFSGDRFALHTASG